MGNILQSNISPAEYFTLRGATIITQEEDTLTLLYKTLTYTFVPHNDHYVFSQKNGKIYTLKTLQECGAVMKADVASLLAAYAVHATVWDGEGVLREVRFNCTHLPQNARALHETCMTEYLAEFGAPVIGVSKVGQLLVNMDATAIERCKKYMGGKIHINWMDVSNSAAKN